MRPDWSYLADLGFSLFPVHYKSKRPAISSWAPFQTKHPSVEEVTAWADKGRCNCGIVTGKISGIIVIDCDSELAFEDVCRRGVPDTPRVRTGRGWHLYFRWPGFNVPNATGILRGVDIRGDGGYVVGPGSTHESGAEYTWDPSPSDFSFAPVPDWLIALLRQPSEQKLGGLTMPPTFARIPRAEAYSSAALDRETMAVASAPVGQRNAQLNKSAFSLGGLVKAGALGAEAVTGRLYEAAVMNGSVGEDGPTTAVKTIQSGMRAAQPRKLPDDRTTQAPRHVAGSVAFFEDEPPRPLVRAIADPEPFPAEALGQILHNAAQAIEVKVRAHPAICGVSVLAAANLAVQAQADVMLPTGQSRPISLHFITIAESGDRKSSVDQEALAPVYAREAALRDEQQARLPAYENEKAAYDRERDKILKSKTLPDQHAVQRALDELGPPPKPPLKPVLLCSEPTFEGLYKLFAQGQPSLGLFSTEGGAFVGGHGMKDEARLRTATGLSRLWDGAPIDRIRAGDSDGDQILVGRRLAGHLMMQPAVASRLLTDSELVDQGLLSRMLVVAPPTLAGTRFWEEPPSFVQPALHAYHTRLQILLKRQLPLMPGRRNELAPPLLGLSDDARSVWLRFADDVEYHLGGDGRYAAIRARANKAPEMAARLAATLALFDDPDLGHVPAEHMGRAITLIGYFLSEAVRLAEGATQDASLTKAAKVLEWLRREWPHDVVSLPDIYQRGPQGIRTLTAAREVAHVLETHGWLQPIPDGAMIGDVRRKQAWRVRRHAR